MERNLGTLVLKQSKSGKELEISNNKEKLLGDHIGVLKMSRKQMIEVLKGERLLCIVTAVEEDEE